MAVTTLYICEKPSQAQDLAAVLGCRNKTNGAIHDGQGKYVTWAVGHLFEQKMPDEIDPAMKQWSLDTLPFLPEKIPLKPVSRTKKQYDAIKSLIKQLNGQLYIATDYDREGEAIARTIIQMSGYRGSVKRVKLSSLDKVSIQRALQDVVDGQQSIGMYYASRGRTQADYHVGMNFSRLYTMVGRAAGLNATFNVGRVVAPTIALVVNREREIQNFRSKAYYEVMIEVLASDGRFKAKWQVPENMQGDEEGRCFDRNLAEQVARQVTNGTLTAIQVEKKNSSTSAPLPFDLTSLQRYCDSKLGLGADETLRIAQKLYDGKYTTYPRTDSRHLPKSQQNDVQAVFDAIVASDPNCAGIVAGADAQANSRVFNDKKVTAHHAIIPTFETVDVSALSDIECKVYEAIRRQYVAQFYTPCRAEKTKIVLSDQNNQTYIAKGSIPIAAGWQSLFQKAEDAEAGDRKDDDSDQDELADQKLPKVQQNEQVRCQDATIEDKQTRPPAHFTEATLLSAMEHVERYEPNPKYRALLKEVSGIGTPATRAETIKSAIKREYLKKEKRNLRPTAKALTMIDMLPAVLTSPAMTARWESELRKVESGEMSLSEFDSKIRGWIEGLVNRVKQNVSVVAPELAKSESAKALASDTKDAKRAKNTSECPICGETAWRNKFKQKKGFYWRCGSCKEFFDDNRGKLVQRKKSPS